MQCRYINLDHAIQRRAAIEASFAKAARPGWTLSRFKAIDTGFIDRQPIAGKKTAAEKACYLSHKALIEAHAASAGHLLVLEDDVEFGIATCEIVDGFLQQNPGAEWDLLFLDVCVYSVDDLVTLYFHREGLMKDRRVIPLDLAKLTFFGTNAYIVNAGSRQKVLACLEAGLPVDVEYDLYLAAQVRQGRLKAAVLFPFLTTLSDHATSSQIQPACVDGLNQARNLFRNFLWLESAPDQLAAGLAECEAAIAKTKHQVFFTLLAALITHFREPASGGDPA
jgi:GR25 family glycosyltransferase involved in LPS biosynthesis